MVSFKALFVIYKHYYSAFPSHTLSIVWRSLLE